jgi:seryl-tRNA synthetase
MHDIRAIRAEPAAFDTAMARRGLPPRSEEILALDAGLRRTQGALQSSQARRREIGREVGEAKRRGGDTAALEREGVELRDRIEQAETAAREQERQLRDILAALPNILDAEVPDGPDETANVVLKQVGEPPTFTFPPREHFELGEALGLMDFATAAKLAGSRFTILRGALARLERALGQFMIDLHTTEHGYEETSVPLLVNDAAVFGTNQLPKFTEDLFRTTDGRWLIPTAEVPLTNTAAGEILPEAALPIRLTALSECFRSEAGSAGRDTRGMLRQHQFRKTEMVSIVRAEDSDAEHERMTRCAETVLERLNLPYRRVLLCAGDTGFGAARTHDLEVWLPGQQAWREISSCSNTRAFQARRMDARVRAADGRIAHVHTLNGSGVAVGRALIAVMENYQRADGSIVIPEVLRSHAGGMRTIPD